jgi:sugar lactone lactonase YvrE
MTAGLFATSRAPRQRRLWLFLLALAALAIGALTQRPSRRVRTALPAPPPPVQIAMPDPERAPPPPPEDERYRVVADADGFFVQIADGRVYWNGNGGLWSAPLDGSGPTLHIVGGWVLTFHVEGEYVTYNTSGAVMRTRVDGSGAPTVLATEVDDPIELASDGKNVYYSLFKVREVHRVDWNGGRAAHFGKGGPSWTLAIDADYLYVAEYGKGRVVKRPLRGGRDIVIASGLQRPVALALDDQDVFISCERDGTVRRVSKRGGRVTTLATGQYNHDILAADDRYVYWGDWGTRALMRVRKDGSAPAEVVMPGLRNIVGVAVSETHIALTSEGRVIVLAK